MTNIPTLTPERIITKITNKKTGEVYETEEALKAANIPEEDVRRDVTVTLGVPADVTSIDLIKYVSLTSGLPDPNGVNAAPLVLSSIPTNLY